MRAATALAVLLLLTPLAAGTPWLMPRADPAGTGYTSDAGPAWPDVALRVELPDEGAWGGLPVVDGVAYVPHREHNLSAGPGGIVAVELDTGESRVLVDGPGYEVLATDNRQLYAAGDEGVAAYTLPDGEHRWTWTGAAHSNQGEGDELHCMELLFRGRDLVVGCDLESRNAETGSIVYQAEVAVLDVETGQARWTWHGGATDAAEDGTGLEMPAADSETGPVRQSLLYGLSLLGPRLLVSYAIVDGLIVIQDGATVYAGQSQIVVYGLDAETGATVWRNGAPPTESSVLMGANEEEMVLSGPEVPLFSKPTGDTQRAFIMNDLGLQAVSPTTGQDLWDGPRQVGGQDTDPTYRQSNGLAYDGEAVFVPTAQTVHRFEAETGDLAWRTTIPSELGERIEEDLIVTPERVYTGGWNRDADTGSVYAFDKATGDILWRHPVGDPQEFSLEGETLVMVNVSGEEGNDELVVLGRTQASPTPILETSSDYPTPGETVRIDLSDSQAGLMGPVTRYRAIWGDGTETPWQTDPVLTHTYDQTGDTTARFIVGNDANQTASTTQTFHVGESEPNLLSEAFAPGNQDLTFGVLGIALALGGGAIGIARRRRQRTRLADELATVEALYEETRDRPAQCEAQLTERRAHARGLLMDGELDEEQFRVVENRIEELGRQLRMGAVEDEFDFLPYSLVKALREMLDDGRVTNLERTAFLQLLDEDGLVHPDQKAVVRQRIEEWQARDRGGAT